MANNYKVREFQSDLRFEGNLLIKYADKRTDKKGNEFVDLSLADNTGEVNAKIWNWDGKRALPQLGRVMSLQGLVQEFNGRLQLRIENWGYAAGEDANMQELVPSAPRSGDEMLSQIRTTVSTFQSEVLMKLTLGMLEDAGNALIWFPAAQRMHHAERGGLLHHTTDMLSLAEGMLKVYPWLNRDLLLSGVIIHDLAKINELKSEPSGNVTDYTRDGQLLGHLVRGITNLNRVADRLNIHGEYLVLLEHMLLSHHGEAEYGSPKGPMFPEAEALHWIDMMDARMNTVKAVADKTPAGAFSEKIQALDRRVYHPVYSDLAD